MGVMLRWTGRQMSEAADGRVGPVISTTIESQAIDLAREAAAEYGARYELWREARWMCSVEPGGRVSWHG